MASPTPTNGGHSDHPAFRMRRITLSLDQANRGIAITVTAYRQDGRYHLKVTVHPWSRPWQPR